VNQNRSSRAMRRSHAWTCWPFRARLAARDFCPKSVAVIAATEQEGQGRAHRALESHQQSVGGTVYPINKRHKQVLGIKAYANVAEVPEPVDLALIVTPAPTVPGIVSECVAAGVKGAIIISAGSRRRAPPRGAGTADRREGARQDAPDRPDCPRRDASRDAPEARPLPAPWRARGTVGFISQSGALLTAVLDWISARTSAFRPAFPSLDARRRLGRA